MKTYLILPFLIVIMLCGCNQDVEPELTFEEKMTLQVAEIDAFLEENQVAYDTTAERIRYVIHKQGEGTRASLDKRVMVAYVGRTIPQGAIFDSSNGVIFSLTGLIDAWQLTIPLLNEGGEITIYAPAVLCYDDGRNMQFDITLIAVDD
jgi:FKBP-type peptidyl-prolyl cis-trans isomerase